ncbi:MAG: class I SAM-dependent methyltransferase [Gemmataceae bacterium]
MRHLPRATTLAHMALRDVLGPGDAVIDATVGNGRDTLFLAERVGPTGMVIGFDLQAMAIAAAQARLAEARIEHVQLIQADHARLAECVPQKWHGLIRAVVFNLGYLPDGDPLIITQPSSTISAIDSAAKLLHSHGVISIVAYRGHAGGAEELQALLEHFADHPQYLLESPLMPYSILAPVHLLARLRTQ